MRVTVATKRRTHARILASARDLFGEKGFEATSTRDLAAAAGVASGTLFNYFRSKDELAAALVADAVKDVRPPESRGESLAEDLFALVLFDLELLAPLRGVVGRVVETTMSPFVAADACAPAAAVRERHLEALAAVLRTHNRGDDADAVAIHLYWTLFLGVLAFWSRDASHGQEDTLAVADRSTRLFAASLEHTKE